MTQKKTTRDLSDLKARLGLAKPAAEPEPAAPAPAPTAAPTGAPTAAPAATPAAAPTPAQPIMPPPGVVPPPGVMPPPGMAQPQAEPEPPDVRRDPFAGAQVKVVERTIVDAGPAIEIPKEKKNPVKLIVAFLITALIPLGVGWACGRIYASRVMFNKAIQDAGKIKETVEKMAKVNKEVAVVLHKSRVKNKGQLRYDSELIENLKAILRKSPDATAAKTKKLQDELFRTNYALMEGIVIERLFNYYNNTIRLMAELESFIRKAEVSGDLLKKYSDSLKEGQRKYGVVFAEDAGSYYLGQFVEVGNIVCANQKAKSCAKTDIQGFMVRTGVRGAWGPRPGKPGKKGRVSEIVIPIIPDEFFRQVIVGRPGYLTYKDYVRHYGRLAAIAAILSKDQKELGKDLGKMANRTQLFVF